VFVKLVEVGESSSRGYAGDVETVKDLGKVWERLGWAGSDDEDGVELAAADEHESKRVRLAPIVSLLVASRAFALRFSLAFFCGGP
jgi:hypothetical protein